MDIAGMLAQSGALDSAAREVGVDSQTAARGAAALLPAILGGFKRSAQAAPGGVDGLGAMLGQMGGGGLLDAVVGPQATPVAQGNTILGSIFGSKDASRRVAADASAKSGIDADTLKKLLPIVAMLAAGYMATQHRGGATTANNATPSGGLGGALGGIMGGGAGAGGLGGMLGQVFGSVMGGGRGGVQGGASVPRRGGIAGMLDMDGDGNPLNDILGMAGGMRR